MNWVSFINVSLNSRAEVWLFEERGTILDSGTMFEPSLHLVHCKNFVKQGVMSIIPQALLNSNLAIVNLVEWK